MVFAFGFFLWRLRDGLLDCVQVLYQFTLEAPQSADGHGHVYALINKLTLFCNMQLNVLNDLAEAMKALDGKKLLLPGSQITVGIFVVLLFRSSFLLPYQSLR